MASHGKVCLQPRSGKQYSLQRAVAQLGSAVAAATGRQENPISFGVLVRFLSNRPRMFFSSGDLIALSEYSLQQRAVAQLGSALEWGSRGPGFKSRRPDFMLFTYDAEGFEQSFP